MPGPANWRRTHTCGELRKEHVGNEVTLNGWVDARRDHAQVYFVDLRDRYGVTQVVVPKEGSTDVKLGPEDCLAVRGEVVARDPQNVNPARATGEVELLASSVEVLSRSKVPPFEIVDDLDTAVETRLQYRFLDLRRPTMQHKLLHRSRFIAAMRKAFMARDFCEIETPILTKATPEGARDYLVPSRVHPGKFYALPQSPQIFKQLLMVSGMDRYFQVARCFRDEDLRADRQPEFTQLDMEMAFVEEEDVFATWEGVLTDTFRDSMGVDLATPFPRLTWAEAMERFGSDKPDTRFGLELVDLEDWARGSEFRVFAEALEAGGRVMGLPIAAGGDPVAAGAVPAATSFSRKDIDALTEVARTYGAGGLAWWKAGREGGSGPLARFCGGERAGALMDRLAVGEGDLCLFAAGPRDLVWRVLGGLRVHLGRKLGLASQALPPEDPQDGGDGGWRFLWVTRFPMFEPDAESASGWTSLHHPFTAPADWELSGPLGELESRAYDLVLNGWELGSGSIRIHRQDVQEKIFALLGIGPEEQREKFGFLLDALAYGAPPHGGFAVGLDRLVALTLGLDSIRDVVAFPKTASAADAMCAAPSHVAPELLREIHVATTAPDDGA